MTITSSQRKKLKSLAHHLSSAVNIGKDGLSEGVFHSISEVLEKYELVKIKFSKNKELKQEYSQKITNKTNSIKVCLIGNILVIYKKSKKPQNRHIKL